MEPTSNRVDALKSGLTNAFAPDAVSVAAKTDARPTEHGPLNFTAPSVKLGADPHDPRRPSNVAELERLGVPQNSREHPAGPAAAPVNAFRPDELNEDGSPRLGTTLNELRPGLTETGHHYVTVNEVNTTDPEVARRAFNGFNAPTHDALNGRPNPNSQTEGFVDPTAPFPLGTQGADIPDFRIPFTDIRVEPNDLGGHVSTHRGETPEGTPWAINTTTPGRHPLRGHITRSLIEHEGRFYVRTEGVGTGPTVDGPRILGVPTSPALGAGRDVLNSIVGPPTFHNLDQRLNEWISSQQ